MDAAQGGVVDDALRSGHVRCEAGETLHRGLGFAAMLGNPRDVEDDPAVHVVVSRGDDDEFGAPRGFAISLEVKGGVGFELV
ncbi:MAG TPA: hypothetical protein VIK61_02715 [Acidimicrobiia bacterium]